MMLHTKLQEIYVEYFSFQAFDYLDSQRRRGWIITINNLTVLINQELSEIPLNIIPKYSPFA